LPCPSHPPWHDHFNYNYFKDLLLCITSEPTLSGGSRAPTSLVFSSIIFVLIPDCKKS
jgi:hypothetical protein